MDVVEAVQQLLDDVLDLRQRELDAGVGQETGEIVFAELKHEEERRLELIVRRGLRPTDLD